jgi:D-arginine dehydrogenase
VNIIVDFVELRSDDCMVPDVLIIGAGLAGSSAAAHLCDIGSVMVLERGPKPGAEGAVQNAGLVRRMDAEPCDRALAQRTHRFLTTTAVEWGHHDLSTAPGAVLGLIRDPLWLHNARAHLISEGVRIEPTDAAAVPLLASSPIFNAWHLPDERVTDGPRLVSVLLERATSHGAQVHLNTAVQRLLIEGGRCIGVETDDGPLFAGHVVLAAGAWSGQLAQQAGLFRPLTPLRRMAAIIDRPSLPDHPWCWLDDVGLYAKPHEGGWMVSPCDEHPTEAPVSGNSTGIPTTTQQQILENKIQRYLPALANKSIRHSWTGLRTFAPDRRPLLGADGECENLWWAAGLGGSGLSSCIGVGEALLTWMKGDDTPWLDAAGVKPNRTQLRRWPILPDGDPQHARLIDSPTLGVPVQCRQPSHPENNHP